MPAWVTTVRYITLQVRRVYSTMEGEGNTYADNAVFANQFDKGILARTNGIALGVGGDVAQVSNVTLSILGSTVFLAEGVDCI